MSSPISGPGVPYNPGIDVNQKTDNVRSDTPAGAAGPAQDSEAESPQYPSKAASNLPLPPPGDPLASSAMKAQLNAQFEDFKSVQDQSGPAASAQGTTSNQAESPGTQPAGSQDLAGKIAS